MVKKVILLVLGFMICGELLIAQPTKARLESPYYIFPREGKQHIALSSDWLLTSEQDTILSLNELSDNKWLAVSYPTSVQMAHKYAGILGDPYMHKNAMAYEPLEQKAWYYKKTFPIGKIRTGEQAFLCFDGVDYFAKVWLNGKLLGTHQGMFGGPNIDITGQIIPGIENEVIVEVLSANYRNPNFEGRKPGNIVKGWFLSGGSGMEPFFNLGIWRDVRIEIVPSYHIERPYMVTESLKDGNATVMFSMEIFAGKHSLNYQLHPWENQQIVSSRYFPSKGKQRIEVSDKIAVKLNFREKGNIAYSKLFMPTVIEGRSFMEERFELENPKLWFPNGMGNPDFYQVEIVLLVNGKEMDAINIDFGVRTIKQVRSAGLRTEDRWHDWQFLVNGEKFFLKGVNWMPVDALYDLTADKYDWAVRMAKSAGIQLFRVWGSGLLESKEFYQTCNKYGIMVWQDFNMANFDTPAWPQEVWEAQVCQNIFRLRNEPSLALWCGGNEFNPYSYGNTASIGIVERNLAIFDPSRSFIRVSPDGGAFHTYPDFDPRWYRAFDLTPAVAETGIHSMTDSKGIQAVIDKNELRDLGTMNQETFCDHHPEFVSHFAEYNPARVPRMLSRASHMNNMSAPSLKDIVNSTQVAAGEFYQVMSEVIQANYPVTTVLMPWVYKRPWPVVAAIHLVDGFGQPSAPYYFLKRTYSPSRVTVQVERLLWARGESFPLNIKVLNGVAQSRNKGWVTVQVFDDSFKEMWSEKAAIDVPEGTSVTALNLQTFRIPENYKNRFFFVLAQLYDSQGKLLSRADYWPRTIPQMEDVDYREKYIAAPVEWPALTKGPWLQPTVAKTKTKLDFFINKVTSTGSGNWTVDLTVENKGKIPSFMTTLELEADRRLFFLEDNFFWLEPGEFKNLQMEVKLPVETKGKQMLVLSSWNTEHIYKQVDFDAGRTSAIKEK